MPKNSATSARVDLQPVHGTASAPGPYISTGSANMLLTSSVQGLF